MVEHGKLSGEYNIVVKGEYDLFDHQVPLKEFEEMLREDEIPDEICIVGLEDVFGDDDAVNELARQIDQAANTLENRHQLPTIQFAVEGSFQRRQRDFELQTDDDLYRLSRIFGSQIDRRGNGWLTAPF